MTPASIPALPRGVRTHFDRVRGLPVLLGPERVLMLDQIGRAVLAELDGVSNVRAISERLADKYEAPVAEIEGDVLEYLQDLAEKRLVDARDG
ncbi:MAG: pyrroloquinoline quinone biosynthesis peptide chaperone PqqD [Paracoccaceae bacterium]